MTPETQFPYNKAEVRAGLKSCFIRCWVRTGQSAISNRCFYVDFPTPMEVDHFAKKAKRWLIRHNGILTIPSTNSGNKIDVASS